MALQTDDDRISDQTPGYDKLNNYDPQALSEQEQSQFDEIAANYGDVADSQQEDANINQASQVYRQESSPRSSWQTNVTAKLGNSGGKSANRFVKIAKKGGPAGIIVGILLGAAGLISFFGGPGLLIVHMVETITDKFDPMSTILTERSDAIINAKLKNSTSGLCTGTRVTVKCKYALMSNRQIERFNRNNSGVRIIVDEGGSRIPGFNRATAIEFDGETTGDNPIKANQFRREMRSNPAFRTAMMDAYNWRFLSKSYKPFLNLAGVRGLTKKPQFDPNDSDADRNNKMKSVVTTGSNDAIRAADRRVEPDEVCGDDAKCRADIEEQNRRNQTATEINDRAKKNIENKRKAAQPSMFKRVVSNATVFGAFSEPCAIPFTIAAIGAGVKYNRAAQLMRYAGLFLVAHSMIKGGDADPGTISFLSSKLTDTVVDEDGNTSKPATESFGYRNAAFGDTGVTDSANQAMMGGHIGGSFESVGRFASQKWVHESCEFMNNPWVIAGGLAAAVIPGVKAGSAGVGQAFRIGVNQAFKIGGRAITINMAMNYFTMLMIDILSGVPIDENTIGEEAGDALVSGTWETTLQAAGFGGGLILDPSQAADFERTANASYLARYQEYERSTNSPFDINSKYTAVGSIFNSMLPHVVKSSQSIVGALTSVLRITASIPSFLSPNTAKAVSTEDYTKCLDYVYREHNFATTEFCNVIRGIPANYVNIDPNIPLDYLLERNHIDEETGAPKPGKYQDFIDKCFLGETPEDDSCMANSEEKIFFALYYIDGNIEDVFQNGLPEPEAVNRVRGNTPPVGEVGRFDDTSLSCPEGTTDDLGVITTRYRGHLTESEYPKIRLCRIKDIPGFGAVPKGEIHEVKTGAVVNAAVAPLYVELARLAKLETNPKIQLNANSSFRIQDSCDIATPGAQCAPPGLSNHQLGISIDFALSDGKALSYPLPNCVDRITSIDPVWKFLNREAANLGIKQIAHENWHWEAGTEGAHLCPA